MPATIEIVENQRWYHIAGWSDELQDDDPPSWSDPLRKINRLKEEYPELGWGIFTSDDYDEEGWIYAASFDGEFGIKESKSMVRSRVWISTEKPKVDQETETTSSSKKFQLFRSAAKFAVLTSKSALSHATMVSSAATTGAKLLQEVSLYAMDSVHSMAVAAVTTEPSIDMRPVLGDSQNSSPFKFPNLTPVERQLVSCCQLEKDRSFPMPPEPKVQAVCSTCGTAFGVTCYRYNCIYCGNSYCRDHLRQRHILRRYGHVLESKLCDLCCDVLTAKENYEKNEWRLERVRDFLDDRMISYFNTFIDTKIHKVIRATEGTIAAAKAAPLGAGAKMAICSLDIVRKYGRAGLASIILRNEFMESFATVKALLGDIKSITFQDAAIGLYYYMAMNRGKRGAQPLLEREEHMDASPINDQLLQDILRYALLSVHVIYQESVLDIQRLAKLQGFTLLFSVADSRDISQPFFSLFAHRDKKVATLVIRGSKSVQDMLTDLRAMPKSVKESHSKEDADCYETFAHDGILKASMWIKELAIDSLRLLRDEGYSIVISGHSLGAGCAALLSVLLRPEFPSLVCYAYAVPACADPWIADSCREYVYSIVLRDDFVPRLKTQNVVKLTEWLASYKDDWREIAAEDWEAYKERAKQIWIPRHREWAKDKKSSIVVHGTDQQQRSSDSTDKADVNTSTVLDPQAAVDHLRRGMSELPNLVDHPVSMEEEWDIHPGSIIEKYQGVQNLHDSHTSKNKVLEEDNVNEDKDGEEKKMGDQELFVPGSIVHVYFVQGTYEACLIDRDDPCLSRIDVFESMLVDHLGKSYIEALTIVRDVKAAKVKGGDWVPFGKVPNCMICNSPFTWNSTSQSIAQQNKDQHNCRKCGSLICDGCSLKRLCLPEQGINFPVRLCDRCAYNIVE